MNARRRPFPYPLKRLIDFSKNKFVSLDASSSSSDICRYTCASPGPAARSDSPRLFEGRNKEFRTPCSISSRAFLQRLILPVLLPLELTDASLERVHEGGWVSATTFLSSPRWNSAASCGVFRYLSTQAESRRITDYVRHISSGLARSDAVGGLASSGWKGPCACWAPSSSGLRSVRGHASPMSRGFHRISSSNFVKLINDDS